MAAKGGSSAISPARREAFAILLELEKGSAHADELLRGARVSALSLVDRNLATALVMGVLRWQRMLDARICRLLTKPNAKLDAEVRITLRLGAFQLLFLDRIPAHAAIAESVALAHAAGQNFAAGMVNAVLRRLAAEKPEPLLTAEAAYPGWMVERWVAEYGAERAAAICDHGQRPAQLALRLGAAEAAEAELADEGVALAPGGLLTAARRVISGDAAATRAVKDGWVRIQDEGSQLIAELAGAGERILDCCAAPGGKTLVLAERNPGAQIRACEMSPARARALRARVAASEFAARIEVVEGNAAEPGAETGFDLVLVDVPCSGTGTLGRNPEIRYRVTAEDLARQAERQRAILRGALRAGTKRVVYSTCSLEPEENGAVVAAVLAESPGWRQVSVADRVRAMSAEGRLAEGCAQALLRAVSADGSLTLLPGEAHDGFFVAMLERA